MLIRFCVCRAWAVHVSQDTEFFRVFQGVKLVKPVSPALPDNGGEGDLAVLRSSCKS
jgi:hypothetical protein